MFKWWATLSSSLVSHLHTYPLATRSCSNILVISISTLFCFPASLQISNCVPTASTFWERVGFLRWLISTVTGRSKYTYVITKQSISEIFYCQQRLQAYSFYLVRILNCEFNSMLTITIQLFPPSSDTNAHADNYRHRNYELEYYASENQPIVWNETKSTHSIKSWYESFSTHTRIEWQAMLVHKVGIGWRKYTATTASNKKLLPMLHVFYEHILKTINYLTWSNGKQVLMT